MVDDMLKDQSKVIDILCNIELIYPPGFFDIMIHLVIHLPLEALEAKMEGLIAEGYVAEEALTFSSHYFRDVTIKFNRPDRNVDCPLPTCQFQVFRSICKSIGLRSVIRIDHQELKKIRQRHVDKDLGVSASSELFSLACRQTPTPISVNSCLVTGVRFVMHSHNERRTTQNSDICSSGEDEEMYYGQLVQILEFSYMLFKTVLFELSVKQCFYLEDMARRPLGWKVVEHVNHKNFSNGGVIVVEDDPDIIHVDNSCDLAHTITLNDLEIAALHINGQSIDVDAPPDIIDVDEDDDIIDDEDVLPHDLADSDDEDLVNVDEDLLMMIF
nr:hypothetical protein [Tanacetum cinerariifolium]